jgi:hypothetical protein
MKRAPGKPADECREGNKRATRGKQEGATRGQQEGKTRRTQTDYTPWLKGDGLVETGEGELVPFFLDQHSRRIRQRVGPIPLSVTAQARAYVCARVKARAYVCARQMSDVRVRCQMSEPTLMHAGVCGSAPSESACAYA